ncbi:calcium-binding and coiled-coil domain-containing protein 2 [Myripristis murdjan]|uniref:calcium-binding and coiled-coil domain-containing protein 2 n=1 Tax=Myripristis murdjan TaxID=586833 RepID=UPI001175CD23|nr:calcium-binding and coiled-coil domain-containing protein 2 [Myripristis murdjan]
MDKPTGDAASDPSAAAFSQVVFSDIPHCYPPAASLTCYYILTAPFQPNARDWVGIFKVGWSTTKDYHTFVWVDPPLDVVGQQPVRKQVVFNDYYLPKDEAEFYQFCYVDSKGQVRGASTPFCFKAPVEQSMDSSLENDLLVITTQEQVEQSVREKAELMKELDHMREESEAMKNALREKQQEIDSLKEQNEQKAQERSVLVKEVNEMKERNESMTRNLKEQQQETDRLKEEMLRLQQQNDSKEEKLSQGVNLGDESLKQQESLTHMQEKYSRAVMKINQLKEVQEELRGKLDVQSVETAELTRRTREQEQELVKLQDNIQLLQVDLQSSEKEKERLSAELHKLQSLTHSLDELRSENQHLRRSLSLQEPPQNIPDDECHILRSQLRDAQAQLASELEESKRMKRDAEQTERQLQDAREQLEGIVTTFNEIQRKSSKLELQLTEAHGIIAEKDETIQDKEKMLKIERQEKEELLRETQNLQRDIEGLRREFADLQAAPLADTLPAQPASPRGSADDATSAATHAQEQDSLLESHVYDNIYENVESASNTEVEQSLVCRHCKEIFPGITQDELVLHEQSHKVCPFCTVICDNMEQSVFEDHVYSHEV